MPIHTNHPDYLLALDSWTRARDVLAGEDTVKAAGERYLPRISGFDAHDYATYKTRASFYNATARTAAGFAGMIFRRAPFVKLPKTSAMERFENDTDLNGTTLYGYAKNTVNEVIHVGRAGTLIDWDDAEGRPYAALYRAEHIVNWRVERIGGRSVPVLIVLAERVPIAAPRGEDEYVTTHVEQRRALKLVPDERGRLRFEVELWREVRQTPNEQPEWVLAERRIPLRRGEPMARIPFVFHGPRHSRATIDKLPLDDVITVNLDHYRLDADYKHGLHFTALPTLWLAGFDKANQFKIGPTTAWMSESPSARAGFCEFEGKGLETFERALERDERLMALLGSRLLEGQKRVAETAEALAIRQAGEESILAHLATSVSESLADVLRWVHWWSGEEMRNPNSEDRRKPEGSNDEFQASELGLPSAVGLRHSDFPTDGIVFELNTDFGVTGMTARDLQSVVSAWQAGAFSRDTMLELLRKGEILPDGRTNEEEDALLAAEGRAVRAN